MKILHAKSVQEKICVGAVCPSMYLFALVTMHSIAVYRTANLAVILSIKLQPEGVAGRKPTRATCISWSPSGRVVAVGFSSGELLLVHVESGEVIRAFTPLGDKVVSALPSVDQGGAAVHAVKHHSLIGPLWACQWCDVPVPSSAAMSGAMKSTCLPLANPATTAPLLAELERNENVSVLAAMDASLQVSLFLGGLTEVACYSLAVDVYFPTASKSASSAEDPSPIAQTLLTPQGKFYFVMRTTATVERTFVVDLSPHWDEWIMTSPLLLRLAVLEEHTNIGDAAIQSSVDMWGSIVQQSYSECKLPESADTLRSLLLPPICSPDARLTGELLQSCSPSRLLQTAESLRDALTTIVRKIGSEAYIAYDTALTIASTLLSEHADDNRKLFGDMDAASEVMQALGERRLRATEYLHFVRRDGENIAELLRWVLQQALKHSADCNGGVATTGGITATASYALEPLRAEQYPHVLRTLHRIMGNQPTAVGLSTFLPHTEAAVGTSFSQVLCDLCSVKLSAPVRDVDLPQFTASPHSLLMALEAHDDQLFVYCTKTTAPHAVPLVCKFEVINVHRCVLECGPAPADIDALGCSDLSGLAAHSVLAGKHILVMERGAVGVALGAFEPHGELHRIERDEGDDEDEDGGKDCLAIDGLKSSSSVSASPDGFPLRISVSAARAFGAIMNRDRFLLIDFDA